jgi:hypothetical protein
MDSPTPSGEGQTNSARSKSIVLASDHAPVPVTGIGPVAGAPAVGPTALSTTAATQLPNLPATRGVYVQALSTNGVSVYIGPSSVTTSSGLELQAGDREFFPVDNANRLYAITGTTTQNVRCLAI